MRETADPQRDHELPLPSPSLPSVAIACLIALIGWGALAAQTYVTIGRTLARGLTLLDGIERMTSYLTNLTVLVTAVCFLCVASRARLPIAPFFQKPPVVTAVVVYMVFVGLSYNLLLRGLWTPVGYRAVLNECLHTVLPLLTGLYWVFFVPRFHLSVRKCLLWLIYPLVYLSATLWRGFNSDFYPYPFIDVDELGYAHVFINVALLFLAFIALMAVFVSINHRRSR
jgi:hypothetical protein